MCMAKPPQAQAGPPPPIPKADPLVAPDVAAGEDATVTRSKLRIKPMTNQGFPLGITPPTIRQPQYSTTGVRG